jgi:uncharacterized protein (TIGR03437 family)
MHFHKKLALAIPLLSLTMAGMLSAQSISIVSGDGAILVPQQSASTLVVLVRNSLGQPVPFTAVTWTLSGQGGLQNSQTVTDVNGQTQTVFSSSQLFGVSFQQNVINASALGSSVNFTEITSGVDPNNFGNPFVTVQLISPVLGDVQIGSAGSTGATAIRAQVIASGFSGTIQGVPNVLLRLIPLNPNGPTIACAGNSGYSDANGNVNCLPVFGGTISPPDGQYTIDIGGGYRVFSNFVVRVTQGVFAAFRITGGNNQTGNPGATLPLALTAHTEDGAGNGVPNVPVVWEPVLPNTVSITNATTLSDSKGNLSATVILGNTVGVVQVRLRNQSGTIQALYTFQVNVAVTGILRVAGDGQDAITNTTFAQPLIVQVNSTQGPAAGIQVQFTSSNGAVVLSNAGLATTDSQGRAQVTAQAGASPGSAVVTASVAGITVTFSLSVRLPGPQITLNSFFNGAGGQPGGVSPTAVLAIYGAGIATGLQGCVEGNQILGPLPLVVSNVTVLFTAGAFSEYAPIYAVCNFGTGQEYVVVQVPAAIPLGSTSVTVKVGGSQTTLDGIPVTVVSPGIFETVMSDGRKRAVLQHSDGSYVSLQNPARANERLRAFVTGLGRPISSSGFALGTNQGGIVGDDASPRPAIIVGVNNEGVNVVSAIYAPDLIGVYVVTFDVQSNVPSGSDINFAVAAVLNDVLTFGNGSKIPIQ